MAADTTAAAITLNPPVAGTRVVRNSRDPSRFVVLPGAVLQAGVTYRISVARTATDIDHQPLIAGATSTFTTSGMSPGAHASSWPALRVRAPTRCCSRRLQPPRPASPSPRRRCSSRRHARATRAAGRRPSVRRSTRTAAAALSPGGGWLAVVERDATVSAPSPGAGRARPGDRDGGRELRELIAAVVVAGRVDAGVLEMQGRSPSSQPGDDGQLTSPASGRSAGGTGSLEPARRATRAGCGGRHRCRAPRACRTRSCSRATRSRGSTGASSNPAISPDGSQLAFLRLTPRRPGNLDRRHRRVVRAAATARSLPRAARVHCRRDARRDQPAADRQPDTRTRQCCG